MFGKSFEQDYTLDSVNLVGDLRDNPLFVPDFLINPQ